VYHQLKTFIEVAESTSFSEAASRLNISQSAVSQTILELEKQANTTLIIRNKRPLKLTLAGEIFLQGAYDIIRKSEEIMSKIELADKGYTGTLRLGFLAEGKQDFLPQGIKEFCEFYPKINLSLQHYNWTGVNRALELEQIDVGVSFSHKLDQFPDLEGKPLCPDKLVLAIHRNHHLASYNSVSISALKSERFVTFHQQTDYLLYDLINQVCAAQGFMPNIVSNVFDMDAILFIVKTGQAISLVPGSVRQHDKDIRFLEISEGNKYFDLMLVWKKGNNNPTIPLFIDKISSNSALKKACSENLTSSPEIKSQHH